MDNNQNKNVKRGNKNGRREEIRGKENLKKKEINWVRGKEMKGRGSVKEIKGIGKESIIR